MNPADRLIGLIGGLVQARALFVSLHLGLLDLLEGSSLTISELAEQLNLRERHVRALTVFLASQGILTTHGGRFSMSPDYRPLLGSESPFRAVIRFECDTSLDALRNLSALLQDDRVGFDSSFFSELFPPQDDLAIQYGFVLAADGAADCLAHSVCGDGIQFRTLVDVGSGLGHYSAALLKGSRDSVAWLIDREQVLGYARSYLSAKEPDIYASGRVVFSHSCKDFFVDEFPASGDLILLSRVLHDWDDSHCLQLLRRCRDSAASGARVVVHEEMLRSDLTGPAYAAVNSLYLSYSVTGGHNRTIAELTTLLEASGWSAPEVLYFNGDRRFSAIVSRAI